MAPTEIQASSDIRGKLSTWGFPERMVPELVAEDDACMRSMYDIHLRRYQTACRYVQGKRVLDIASGTGFGSKMLREAGAEKVIGVDISSTSIQYATARYQIAGVIFVEGDAETFESPELFDVIVSFETLEHIPHPDLFLTRLSKLLKPDGHFLLSVPLGETRHIDPYHLHVFQQDDVFRTLSRAGFVVDAYRCDDWVIHLADLRKLKRTYPEANPSLKDLLFTWRGRRLLWDLMRQGCIAMPQLLVHAQLATAIPNPPEKLLPLD